MRRGPSFIIVRSVICSEVRASPRVLGVAEGDSLGHQAASTWFKALFPGSSEQGQVESRLIFVKAKDIRACHCVPLRSGTLGGCTTEREGEGDAQSSHAHRCVSVGVEFSCRCAVQHLRRRCSITHGRFLAQLALRRLCLAQPSDPEILLRRKRGPRARKEAARCKVGVSSRALNRRLQRELFQIRQDTLTTESE